MSKKQLSLYVWERCLSDHSDGMAFAIAHSEKEARELVARKMRGLHGFERYMKLYMAEDFPEPPIVLPLDQTCAFFRHGSA